MSNIIKAIDNNMLKKLTIIKKYKQLLIILSRVSISFCGLLLLVTLNNIFILQIYKYFISSQDEIRTHDYATI